MTAPTCFTDSTWPRPIRAGTFTGNRNKLESRTRRKYVVDGNARTPHALDCERFLNREPIRETSLLKDQLFSPKSSQVKENFHYD